MPMLMAGTVWAPAPHVNTTAVHKRYANGILDKGWRFLSAAPAAHPILSHRGLRFPGGESTLLHFQVFAARDDSRISIRGPAVGRRTARTTARPTSIAKSPSRTSPAGVVGRITGTVIDSRELQAAIQIEF